MKTAASNPFYKKRFFLDINGCHPDVEINLLNDLKWLGAKEAFHCKDAAFAVSNRVTSVQNKPKTTNSPVHSPQLLSDNSMDLNSPEYANSQVLDRKSISLSQSRGKVLLQKSQQIIKKHGTTDTLAVCKQYGVKVYHIDKVLSYVKKIKNLYSTKKSSNYQERSVMKNVQSKFSSPNNDVQKIRAPFVKIEDFNRQYRTRHRVFSSWADIIDPALSQSVKEFHKNFVINGSVEHRTMFRPILKDISVNKLSSQFLMPITLSKSFTRQSTTHTTSSTETRKKPEIPFQCADKKKKCRRKKRQYCEICSVYYSNLNKHIENKSHLKFMDDATNYRKLEQLVEKLPKFIDIMKNLPGYIAFESRGLSKSCNYRRDTNLVVQQVTPCKEINFFSSSSSEFATELYNLDDESIISATCSTASTGFSFLRDNLDVSPEILRQDIKSCLEVSNNQFMPDNDSVLENFQPATKDKDLNISNLESSHNLKLLSNSYLELKETNVNERQCRKADLQTGVSVLEFSKNVAVDEEQVAMPIKTPDLKALLVSMPESFESCMFFNNNHSWSKKRKRGTDLETYMLKKFLCYEHISDLDISNEIFHDSGFCSIAKCDQNLSQQTGSYTSVHGNLTDSYQAVDLSVLNEYASNSNLKVSIPVSVPDFSCSFSPPKLDLCKEDLPILTCNDLSYSSTPALTIQLLDSEKLTLDQINLSQIKNFTISPHSNVLESKFDTFNNGTIKITILKAPHMEDKLMCCENTYEIQIVRELSQSSVLEPSSETKDRKTGLFLNNLMLGNSLLFRASFLYYQKFCTSESFLKRLLTISYTSFYLGKFAEIYISQNKQLPGNVILRLNKVLKEDGISQIFIILNAFGKNITYKFIKHQLTELSFLNHPGLSKHLQFICNSLTKKFRLWQKYSIMGCFSNWISETSRQTNLLSSECHLCRITDIFIPYDNPICLEKDCIDLVSRNNSVYSTTVDLSMTSSQSNLRENDVPLKNIGDTLSNSSNCCSFDTLARYDCTESSESGEEYIIVDSCSEEMELNPFSEEF